MGLTKWIRRNERKIFAVVVIVIMVGFIGGSYLSQLGRGDSGQKALVAHYGLKGKITNYDRAVAQQELEVLQSMRVGQILRGQDLSGVFLSELLFADGRMSPELLMGLKRAITSQGLRISDEQIKGMYSQAVPGDIYWILLKSEADRAGVVLQKDAVGGILGRLLPQLFEGATYSQVMEMLIRRGVTEQAAQDAFANLLAVLEYSRMICSDENTTDSQIRRLLSLEGETISTEYVKFNASVFADEQPEPTDGQIREQFEKYKGTVAAEPNEKNLYGFGYKLDDMAVVEYVALKMDDISEITEKPTQQEKEDYYQAHPEQFTEQIPIDANDPNSPMTERIKGYGQVAKIISDRIYQQRIHTKAQTILGEAKRLTEESLGEADIDELDAEKLKELAAEYGPIAEKLSGTYSVKVYSGKTGLLSLQDMAVDKYLSGLFLKSRSAGQMPTSLAQTIFSAESLGGSGAGLSEIRPPKMYEDIGPAWDMRGKTAVVVRVVQTKEASEPASLEDSFSKVSISLDEADESAGQQFSVKEKVVEDLKKLAAMTTAEQKAQEFADAAEKGWDVTLEQFNKRYAGADSNEPNTFGLLSWPNLKRYSRGYIETLAFRGESERQAQQLMKQTIIEARIVEKLYSLVPADSDKPAKLPVIVKIEPDMSYYLIKNLTINRLYSDKYQNSKATWAYRSDNIEVQNLAAVHFQPDNILKRMNFKFVETEDRGQKTEDGGQKTEDD